ncbi:MAG: type II toxin-antitoxin system mRNA interferase toxin, RelE/StbE family [Thermoguttaceae bacterium]
MKRSLIRSNAFLRDAKRLAKSDARAIESLFSTLAVLEQDAFDPGLKTHKLKGDLEGSWACSFGYDLRIVFEFIQHEGKEAILLESLGTHDQVY